MPDTQKIREVSELSFTTAVRAIGGALRLKEIFLMTGFSFIGILFTNPQKWNDVRKDGLILFTILFYVMAVYFLNSFADYNGDVQSKRLGHISRVSRNGYLLLLIIFTSLFASFAAFINFQVFIFTSVSLLLWATYYVPPIRLKSTMLAGTGIHFIAGILHFHMGYCTYSAFGLSSFLTSIFFALLLSAGHFHHEILDYEGDMQASNKTTAVRIGLPRMYLLRTGLTGLTFAYWTSIFLAGKIDTISFLSFAPPTVALFLLSLKLQQESQNQLYQKLSRLLFMFGGITFAVVRLAITYLQ